MKRLIALVLCLSALYAPCAGAAGVFSPNEQYEYLVGATAWQLSAECQALIVQAYASAKYRIAEMALKCFDKNEPDWTYETGADGGRAMYYQGRRVAVICDIDDTLVDGAHYTANIVGADGDINNVAFARFVMSEGCTALPGAVAFTEYCALYGLELFYITNRFDQGYKIGQSDTLSSYAQTVGEGGKGLYLSAGGEEIGTTVYQALGASFYDITLESMARLGFSIDDQHLIMNDNKLYGESKEKARAAVREGAESYPNGQRADGNRTNSSLALSCGAHYIALLLGDQAGDFTDAFSDPNLDAVSRAALAEDYSDKWGSEWIVLPNAVYGGAMNSALRYGIPALFEHYSYIK